jgi:hypothetical protein
MNSKSDRQTYRLDTYQAYLIRLWQDGDQAVWRASAQSVQSGEIVRFADLTGLFAYLEAQTGHRADTVTSPTKTTAAHEDMSDV